MRALLAAVAAAAAADPHDHHADHAGETAAEHAAHAGHSHSAAAKGGDPSVSTLDLRIAAIFVIWAGALLFGLPTLVFKAFRSADALVPRLLRAFAGGTIVALALVHIVPEAVHQLEELTRFHLAGCTILFGIVVLVLIDNSVAAFLAPEPYKQHIRDSLQAAGSRNAAHGSSSSSRDASGSCHARHSVTSAAAGDGSSDAASPPAKQQQHDQQPHHHAGKVASDSAADIVLSTDLDAIRTAAAQSHSHQCMRSLNAAGWVSSAVEAPTRNVRQYVTAYTMELGCIFHSVIIGVGVGVIQHDRQLVTTLMIALAIHQGLEALALGSVLALTSFPAAKKVAMLLLYSITTPIGVAIGIAVAATYDPDSVTSKAVQGTFNGVSAGMLLYIGMYQLIAEEFSREDLLVRPRLRYGMYAALLAGSACMCILGVWA